MPPHALTTAKAPRNTLANAVATRRLLAAIVLFAAIALPVHSVRAGSDLIVRYDQSQLLRLPRAVSDVIIGNPSIADVTVQASNLLVVTGKTFGVTNIIALDSDRNIIQDQRVIVQRDEGRTVNVMKAGTRMSFSCTPECSPTITMGDDMTYFENNLKHASAKTRFSTEGAEPGTASKDNQ
jgi:Flp pilus assembly secretin CpaC